MSITAIVLCGGRSTRMGQDKGALPFGPETMLERVTRLVRGIAGEVIVVGRPDQQPPADVRVVYDPVADLGPLAGLAAGLSASTNDLNIVVACDKPLVQAAVLQRLVAWIGDYDACVAMNEGHASALCGVYRSRVAGAARTLLDAGERRVMRLLDRVNTKRVDAAVFRDVDPELETFVSCDTAAKYHWALARVRAERTSAR
jgi:molybdopterin-guanine dinucleotide biosynthesis protein A